jgi:segregation and condensation protein B
MERGEEIESNNSLFEKQKNKDITKDLSDDNNTPDLDDVFEKKEERVLKNPNLTGSTIEEIEQDFSEKEKNAQELVEASLFIAGRFLTIQDLIILTDLNQILIIDILKKLIKKYSSGVIRIIERNNSFKMDVAQEYHYLINKLASGSTEFTKAEQETLAIIAYKQPVKQSVVIKIRGNKSYDHIKKFVDLGLVVSKPLGHTLVLSLSEEFYEYFNVHNKEEKEN